MKQGRTLTELVQELERQLNTKKDFKAPTGLMRVDYARRPGDTVPALRFSVGDKFHGGLMNRFHQQIAQHTGIPTKYYDRLREEAPELLAHNLNHWLHFQDQEGKTPTQLIRTIDGNARAFLSNRYRAIDNYDIAATVLPILHDKKVQVVSSEVTEDRLYIKAVTEKLTFKIQPNVHTRVPVGMDDVVQAGIVISNSEVGCGAVRVEPILYRLICLNGAIIEDARVRKFHIGRAADELETAFEVFQDETRKQDDKAFMMKLRDVVLGAFDEIRFRQIAETTQEAEGRLIPGKVDPQEVVEVISQRFHLSDDEEAGVKKNLFHAGSLSQWALANAVTALANDTRSYERATELERIGGNVITMSDSDWKQVVQRAEQAAA